MTHARPPIVDPITADLGPVCEACGKENFEGELVLAGNGYLICADCVDWSVLIAQASDPDNVFTGQWAWADTRRP